MSTTQIYAVLPGNETPEEPTAGWYYSHDDDGVIHGAFRTREDAEHMASYRGEDNAQHEGAEVTRGEA